MTVPSTAILIFARSARLDARHKGFMGCERLFESLTSQTVLIARRTGLPCYHFDEHAQTGETFGERLGNAMNVLFEQGVENLIVIGNDSPDLRTKTLLLAAEQLIEGNSVFGPSGDGGTYLIGIRRSQFDLRAFVSLSWQQKNLLKGLIQWNISAGGRPVLLKSELDLDSPSDCRRWFAGSEFISTRIHRLLLTFTSLTGFIRTVSNTRIFHIRQAVPFNKGSPF